jgi:D-inositol-3-phosphate glycosyltransferase
LRICHITPSLPPEYTAVATLPVCLGWLATANGDEVQYISNPAPEDLLRRAAGEEMPGPVLRLPPQTRPDSMPLGVRTPAAVSAVARAILPHVRWADVLHMHGNTLLATSGALVAELTGKPTVLTLYGTEIWEYQVRRWRPDLFTRAYRKAAHVAFYSQGLLTRAMELGLGRRNSTVIYPPVAHEFTFQDEGGQADARAALGIRSRHVLVTVKRVDTLGGHRHLLEALSEIIRTHPDTRLVICGTGPLIEDVKAAARSWGVEGHVTFTGPLGAAAVARYDAAADAFVLASQLDSCPTGALEALACGTPVIATDNPGGLEIREIFGFDVTIVPRENPMALARALVHLFEAKRRVRASTIDVIDREFRPEQVFAQYRALYSDGVERAAKRARKRQSKQG